MYRVGEKFIGAFIAFGIVGAMSPYALALILALNIIFGPATYYIIKHDRPPTLDTDNRLAHVIYYVLVTWFYALFIAAASMLMLLAAEGIMSLLGGHKGVLAR